MLLYAHVRRARERLVAAGIPSDDAVRDAELLARHALGWDRATLIARSTEEAPAAFEPAFAALIDRRARREPVAYIRGTQEFWGRDFVVGPGVLIPRPETEFVVEEALAWARSRPSRASSLRVLDIGTGSGCLAITLALEQRDAQVSTTDISPAALAIARANSARLDADVRFHLGAYTADAALPVDLIVSNPPYIPAGNLATLQPEVRQYEPWTALAGGPEGLDIVREVVRVAATALDEHGRLLMEIGYGQAEDVRQMIAATAGLVWLGVRDDLQGIPRVAMAARAQLPGTPPD